MRKTELASFKKALLAKKEAILANNAAHKISTESLRAMRGDEGDAAAASMQNALDAGIFRQHNDDLEYIDIALEKIKNGNYGICEMCEEQISMQRLRAKPHARYCIDCREIIEKQNKNKKRTGE